jgi:hypothetical protein
MIKAVTSSKFQVEQRILSANSTEKQDFDAEKIQGFQTKNLFCLSLRAVGLSMSFHLSKSILANPWLIIPIVQC